MPEIVLIRHGQTEWSRSGRHTSTTDIPLTPVGEREAKSLAAALAGRSFGLVLSSPRQRARHTAELAGLFRPADLAEPHLDLDLVEWNYGDYEGLTTDEIGRELGRPWSLWDDGVPGGESLAVVAVRVARVIARAEPVLAAGDDVALIAHGHVLRVLAACWTGLPPMAGAVLALSSGSLSTLGFEHDRRVITGWNNTGPQTP